MTRPNLPKFSTSQAIGDFGKRSFQAQIPNSWLARSLDGDDDLGFDFKIQFLVDGLATYDFHVQLKASESPAIDSTGTYISAQLKSATANYYLKTGNRTLLVVADVSVSDDPSRCPLYYTWVHDELKKRQSKLEREDAPTDISVRVPIANRLDRTTDFLHYLETDERRRIALADLVGAVESNATALQPIEAVSQLAKNISKHGALFVESAIGSGSSPLATQAPGTTTWHLKQASVAISSNDRSTAAIELSHIEEDSLRDDIERAEFAYQRGRLSSRNGDAAQAKHLYESAAGLRPLNPQYAAALLETRLRASPTPQLATELLQEIEDRQQDNAAYRSDEVLAFKARLLNLVRRDAEAHAILTSLPLRTSAVERSLELVSRHAFSELDALIELCRHEDVDNRQVRTIKILRESTRFEVTFARDLDIVPSTGGPTLDPESAQEVLRDVLELCRELQQAGWPPNSEYLLPALASASVALRRPDEALPFLRSFHEANPHDEQAAMAYLMAAIHADRPEEALRVARSLRNPGDRVVNEALIQYSARDFQAVAGLSGDLLLAPQDTRLLDSALAICALCCREVLDLDAESAIKSRLLGLESGTEHLAVVEFVGASDRSPDESARAIQAFRSVYEKSPDSDVLQDHACYVVEKSDSDLVDFACALVGRIQSRRQLSPKEVVTFCGHWSRHGRLDLALSLMEAACRRLPNEEQLLSMQALLYEQAGEAAKAIMALETLMEQHGEESTYRHNYIAMALRSGLLPQARKQLKAMGGSAKSNRFRKEAWSALFNLELSEGASPQLLHEIIGRYGALADANSEREEATYLNMLLMAGEPPNGVINPAISQRFQKFFEKHPNSRYLSRFSLPEDLPADQLLQRLVEATGQTPESIAELKKRQVDLERGQAIVPYLWRPRVFLGNVSSVSHLWELTKLTKGRSPAYHMQVTASPREVIDLRTRQNSPVIDLATLLVATDLNLWPAIFALWNRVAITKGTLRILQEESLGFGGRTKTAERLHEALATNLPRIVQIGSAGSRASKFGGLEVIKRVVRAEGYAFYCDDIMAQTFVLGDDERANGINSIDVIESARRAGYLTAREAAEKIGQMVAWGLGPFQVPDPIIFGAIPVLPTRVSTFSKRVQILREDPTFNGISRAIWGYDKKLTDSAKGISAVLTTLADERTEGSSPELVEAVWGAWIDLQRIRSEAIEITLPLTHTTCLALVGSSGDSKKAKIFWDAALAILTDLYGDHMEKAIENKFIGLVARMIARSIAASKGAQQRADEVIAAFRGGWTEGTERDSVFLDAYIDERRKSG